MKFEWDAKKNKLNIEKHGISFQMASEIFNGFTVDAIDDRFDYEETRIISLGKIQETAIIVVVHTDRNGIYRIISARSARPAKKKERNHYEQKIQESFSARRD